MDDVTRLLYSTRRIKHTIFQFLENLIGKPYIITSHAAAHVLPDNDFLNLNNKTWANPWDTSLSYDLSFPELFKQATRTSAVYIKAVADFFDGRETLEDTLHVLGDRNYNSGLEAAR